MVKLQCWRCGSTELESIPGQSKRFKFCKNCGAVTEVKKKKKVVSKQQAKILLHLLSYGDIHVREGGYFDADSEFVNYRSLNALCTKGLVIEAGRLTIPSAGLISSPTFNESSVTQKGKEAFREFVKTLPYYEKEQWLKQAKVLEEE